MIWVLTHGILIVALLVTLRWVFRRDERLIEEQQRTQKAELERDTEIWNVKKGLSQIERLKGEREELRSKLDLYESIRYSNRIIIDDRRAIRGKMEAVTNELLVSQAIVRALAERLGTYIAKELRREL